MSIFDDLALDTERPFRVLLVRPDDGTPLVDKDNKQSYVDVISSDSKRAKELQLAATDKRLSGVRQTAQDLEDFSNRALAELSVGWYLVRPDGVPIAADFSVERAFELYSDPRLDYITEQVRRGSGLRKNFMPAPSKT